MAGEVRLADDGYAAMLVLICAGCALGGDWLIAGVWQEYYAVWHPAVILGSGGALLVLVGGVRLARPHHPRPARALAALAAFLALGVLAAGLLALGLCGLALALLTALALFFGTASPMPVMRWWPLAATAGGVVAGAVGCLALGRYVSWARATATGRGEAGEGAGEKERGQTA